MRGPEDGEATEVIPVTEVRDEAKVRRTNVLSALAAALMVVGIVLAALQPPWLTEPLQAAVVDAGPAAPLVFIVLNILLAPLHLNGIVILLSTLAWPLPMAWALSFVGSLLGCVLTMAALGLIGRRSARTRAGWPPWLDRLSARVGQRPYLVGILARMALHSGIGLEAFYLVTGYTRRQYLVTTVVGVAIWITQTLAGIYLLAALTRISSWLGLLAIVVPVLLLGGIALLRRRRAAARNRV